ncbi:hypothetical protein [Clostridium sardiniense]|uniref:hypothetical protein n=1 Tax=Clostridium sardiniense TaxID=29369 RepID=UPI00195898DA|nr:hypothetical protein [Clostridium sardiniense]MBM7836307.1 hypothetical protein [Clostridium sardiniense]
MKNIRDNFLKIKKEIAYKNEARILNKYFIKKNLRASTVQFLLNDQLDINDLDVNEQIALCKGLSELGYEEFNPTNYFTSSQLLNFETLVIKENHTNIMEFENVSEYNDDLYHVTAWKPSEHVKAWKNRNIRYNFDAQRQSILSIDRWGNVTQKMNINRESVNAIKKLIKEKKYFPPDMLTFNILQLEDKEPLVKYDGENRKLVIKTEPDFESPNTTFFDVVDGAHRTIALVELYDEGVNIDDIFLGFPVQISITTVEEANAFIYRQAQANRQNEVFLEQRIEDKYKKFIDKVESYGNKETNILFNNISDSYERMKLDKKVTYVGLLKSALRMIEKNLDINFDSRAELNFGSRKIVEVVNTIAEILKEEGKEYIYENNCNIYFGFFVLAYYLKINKVNEDKMFDILFEIVQNMIKKESELNKLKLNVLNTNYSKIYNFFVDLLEEVK